MSTPNISQLTGNSSREASKSFALSAIKKGLSAYPAKVSNKHPADGWKDFQRRIATEAEISAGFNNPAHDAVCIICGEISGRLEVIDFDRGGAAFEPWKAKIPAELFSRLAIEKSQSGGRHIFYKCTDIKIPKGVKLAMYKGSPEEEAAYIAKKTKEGGNQGENAKKSIEKDGAYFGTLIETRAEGQLVVCSPSAGYEMIQGDLLNIPTITTEERDLLLCVAYSLTEAPVKLRSAQSKFEGWDGADKTKPGGDFNSREDTPEKILELLTGSGWGRFGDMPDGRIQLSRPGVDDHIGGTLYPSGIFYCFSSNAEPFEAGKGNYPFSTYALLAHEGNFHEAAAALRADGYGDPPKEAGRKGIPVDDLARDFLRTEYTDEEGLLKLRFYDDKWWSYAGGRYRIMALRDLESKVIAYTQADGRFPTSKNLTSNIIAALSSAKLCGLNRLEYSIPCRISTKESLERFFPVANGMIDAQAAADAIKTGAPVELLPLSPDVFAVQGTDYKFDPASDCPKWKDFISKAQPDKRNQDWLQMMFGLILTADKSYNVGFFLVGDGGEGKGTILDILTALVGVGLVPIRTLNLSGRNSVLQTFRENV